MRRMNEEMGLQNIWNGVHLEEKEEEEREDLEIRGCRMQQIE